MEREIPDDLIDLVTIAKILSRVEYTRVDCYRMIRERMPTLEQYLPRKEERRRAELIVLPGGRKRKRATA